MFIYCDGCQSTLSEHPALNCLGPVVLGHRTLALTRALQGQHVFEPELKSGVEHTPFRIETTDGLPRMCSEERVEAVHVSKLCHCSIYVFQLYMVC